MVKVNSSSSVVALAILILGLSGLPLTAQQSEELPPRNVISANPFGILFDLFNAEYERVISPTTTIGFGGSTMERNNYAWEEPPIIGTDDQGYPIYGYCGDECETIETFQYVNFDVFWRFYPGSNRTRTYKAPIGWAFGVKAGITTVDDGTYLGYGFDLNKSWVLGPDDNFYVGLGFGLKRLAGADGEDFEILIPTIRIANVGFIF
jgi:hypothetical protein